MPTLVRLPACKVAMYADDHLPPHFHIIDNDGRQALVEIASLTVIRGAVSKAAEKQAMLWAIVAQSVLTNKWRDLNP